MMALKSVFFLLTYVSFLSGAILLDLQSFQADFVQQIDDKEKKVVRYVGKVYAKKPRLALWRYVKPVQKSVYVDATSVVVVEPELEQAIIRNIRADFDIFTLLKRAKKIAKNLYVARYEDTVFTLRYDGKDIQTLTYTDSFDNTITVTFSNQKYNETIPDALFTPSIPADYDIITE